MRAYPTRCPHCRSTIEFTLVVPQSHEDPIQVAERLAMCPRCDAPSPAPPARPM